MKINAFRDDTSELFFFSDCAYIRRLIFGRVVYISIEGVLLNSKKLEKLVTVALRVWKLSLTRNELTPKQVYLAN